MSQECDYRFKITLLGESSVGKTSILFRYVKDIFDIIGDRPGGFWCVESAGTIRGGKDYMPPLDGWNGLGLKVADKYDDGNNNWLGYEHEDGEYAIAYMGINKLLDNEENQIKQNIKLKKKRNC